MRRKNLLIPMPLALHTKLKFKAKSDGVSMSEVVRQLVGGYVNGTVELGEPQVQVARPTVVEELPDVYDQLADRTREVLNL